MTLKTDSILNVPIYNGTKAINPVVSNTKIALYNSVLSKNIDTFESDNPKPKEKTSKVGGKIMKGVGITAGGLVFLSFALYAIGRRRYNAKVAVSLSNELKNDGLEELVKLMDFKTFSKIKMFSNLSKYEKKRMHTNLTNGCDDLRIFFPTLMGKKPACYLNSYKRTSYLRKINLETIDPLIFRCKGEPGIETILFNKPEVLKLIERNKKIYTARLSLNPNAKTEEIYSKLKEQLKTTKYKDHDLLGITLGFPKYDSMIFELEHVGKVKYELRENPAEFKKEILKVLRSDKSPYKSLDETELRNLENAINNIKEIDCHENIYRFIDFTQDKEELGRIAIAESEFIKEFKVQDLL